jgi:hypothetical protein
MSNFIKQGTPDDQKYLATTTSPQAYKYSLEGDNSFARYDYATAINIYLHAVAIDSTYFSKISSKTLLSDLLKCLKK